MSEDILSTFDLNKEIKLFINEVSGIDIEDINEDKTFSQLGLDSTSVVMLSGKLSEVLGDELSPNIAFNYPTIKKLTQQIETIIAYEKD